MGYRVNFGLRLLAVAAIVGLVVWGASAAEIAAPKGLKTAFGALTGGSPAKAAEPTAKPTTAPTATTSAGTGSTTAGTSTTATGTATPGATATTADPAATVRPFMATVTNTCVPDPSLPKTYYAGRNCDDPDLRYTKYLVSLSNEVYHVVGYQPKMVQLGEETCGELADYDQARVMMDVTQWLVAEQNPTKPRQAALSVLNAATKNLCPTLRTKVTIA
ncbi:DUF732 domain-containing protein [Cryptosporangium sp. NPDC051539]|uniref:DUF732 domain-containing protein n=1 Tax=Cryptosporangium sp. NPDC051539 TaxID=3363962 RepID=UPI0037902DB9